MNAPNPFPTSLAEAHEAATNDVNRWRGHCLDLYARIERDCIETIDTMIASGRMPELRHASLFGARIGVVHKALESGHFGRKPKALETLKGLDDALLRRNDIVHGVGKVWIDIKGNWQWEFAYRDNANKQAEVSGFISLDEAKEIKAALSSGARSLGDRLKNLKREISENNVNE